MKKIRRIYEKLRKNRLYALGILLTGMFTVVLGRFFSLQILQGDKFLQEYQEQIEREEDIEAGRGTIYDRNGIPLAYNELAYSITIVDDDFYDTTKEHNETLNQVISDTISLLERYGDHVENILPIQHTELGGYAFTVENTRLQRFRADIFGHSSIEELEYNESLGYHEAEATAGQIIEYLCSDRRFGVEGFGGREALQISAVRYAMSLNAYRRYTPTTIARDVSQETLAAIAENEAALPGVTSEEQLVRRYTDSYYFSHLLGYTGQISEEELQELSEQRAGYTTEDSVGKAGIEQFLETQLQGTKGGERFYVDSVGRVTDRLETTEPVPGNDVYLTIDADLQRIVYRLLEQRLAGIVYANLVEGGMPEQSEDDADNVRITSDEVYFALIDNQVLDTEQFMAADRNSRQYYMGNVAQELNNSVLAEFPAALETPYEQLPDIQQSAIDVAMTLLNQEEVFVYTNEVLEDESYRNWQSGKISFQNLMEEAVSKDWLNLEHLTLERTYVTTEEIVTAIKTRITEQIPESRTFEEMLYEHLIRNGSISGYDVCLALYEQEVLSDEEGYVSLSSREISAYSFIREKIRTLQITPAQLALDPSTASSVVVDPNNGQVLACVTYPGYDNNRLANTVDAEYYNQLLQDESLPLYNNATQQRTAPGSTFKPVTAAAGISEGVITPYSTITDRGSFEKVTPSPECWFYPNGTHGDINVSEAIRDSCNYFFYETAFRFSDGQETEEGTFFDEEKGISILAEEARNFGLGDGTGIQLTESSPQLADEYPITAAIGQSNFAFTTTQLARYAATLANGGDIYNLNLIDRVEKSSQEMEENQESEPLKRVENVTSETWQAIHTGMEMMAEDSGYFEDMPVSIAGKTGTAEQANNRPNHALFIGYASTENPELALATRIAYGYGSSNAAEVSADILRYYYEVETEQELVDGIADNVGMTGNRIAD